MREALAETATGRAEEAAASPTTFQPRRTATGETILAGQHFGPEHLADLAGSGAFPTELLLTAEKLDEQMQSSAPQPQRYFSVEKADAGGSTAFTGQWREEVPLGWVADGEGLLHARMLDAQKFARYVQQSWGADAPARELWANAANMLSDAWDYLRTQAGSREMPPSAKRDALDRVLGLGAPDATDNPLYARELNAQLGLFLADRRLDRINRLEPVEREVRFRPGASRSGGDLSSSPASSVADRDTGGEKTYPERGTPAYERFNFGRHLRGLIEGPPDGMYDPHAHHILFKEGLGAEQKALVEEGHALLRRFGIDPIYGQENLTWAPMRVKDQHSTASLKRVVQGLKEVEALGGGREDIILKLKESGREAAQRRKIE